MSKAVIFRGARWVALLAAGQVVLGCASLKPPTPQAEVVAMEPAASGVLAEVSRDARARVGPRKSGFVLLEENREAMDWQLALIDSAERSIDMQTFLWESDDAGRLVFARLIDAADRGVRVRILVDDFLFTGDERKIAVVSRHPNLEIKIFNPGYVRGGTLGGLLEFVMRFKEMNRRMHNKAFVADGQVAIVGGRNVGGHYAGLAEEYNFVDLQVLTTGEVVRDVSEGFDEFWNSDAAYPGREMWEGADGADSAKLVAEFREEAKAGTAVAQSAGFPLEPRDWTDALRGLRGRWHRGEGIYFHDEPVTDPKQDRKRFLDELRAMTHDDEPEDVILVSPYLIPDEGFLTSVERLIGDGARLRILAPSMGANNQLMVHSHYRQYRRELIALGVELYELREDGGEAVRAFSDSAPVRAETVGLHMKGYVRDRDTAFIGSLNIDPRSIEINTEGGLWIESPGLAREVTDHFEFLMNSENAWQVKMDGRKLRWESRGETVHRQPAPSGNARIKDAIYGVLPIRGQL